jgi:hypothetical protein
MLFNRTSLMVVAREKIDAQQHRKRDRFFTIIAGIVQFGILISACGIEI